MAYLSTKSWFVAVAEWQRVKQKRLLNKQTLYILVLETERISSDFLG